MQSPRVLRKSARKAIAHVPALDDLARDHRQVGQQAVLVAVSRIRCEKTRVQLTPPHSQLSVCRYRRDARCCGLYSRAAGEPPRRPSTAAGCRHPCSRSRGPASRRWKSKRGPGSACSRSEGSSMCPRAHPTPVPRPASCAADIQDVGDAAVLLAGCGGDIRQQESAVRRGHADLPGGRLDRKIADGFGGFVAAEACGETPAGRCLCRSRLWPWAGGPCRERPSVPAIWISDQVSILAAISGVTAGPPRFQPLWMFRLSSRPSLSASRTA